jgi:hypothetical protein
MSKPAPRRLTPVTWFYYNRLDYTLEIRPINRKTAFAIGIFTG